MVAGLFVGSGTAAADPSASDWAALRKCESSGRYDINTGNGYYGAYQFDLPTWRSVGGTGYPHQASPAEQDYRALYLYRMRGWQPWVCARLAGLREDSSARSRVVPPYGGVPVATPAPTPPAQDPGGAPAYPGRQFRAGDFSEDLRTWQRQMGARGYGLTGTGFFGPKTSEVVLRLQRESGLSAVGFIGPQTWAAAWSGPAVPAQPARPAPPPAPVYTPPTASGCSVGASSAPAWPGETYTQGDTSPNLQCWQKQMGHRGAGLIGTGFYGPTTRAVVVALQQRNGLNPSGILGPKTWAAAWTGR